MPHLLDRDQAQRLEQDEAIYLEGIGNRQLLVNRAGGALNGSAGDLLQF